MIRVVENFVGQEESALLLGSVRSLLSRLPNGVQRHAARFGYAYAEGSPEFVRPIPPWIFPVRERVQVASGEIFDSVTVNQYASEAGLAWHRDHGIFGPVISVLSLGAPAHFLLEGSSPLSLASGTLLVLTDKHRNLPHSVRAVSDRGNTRTSFVFRRRMPRVLS